MEPTTIEIRVRYQPIETDEHNEDGEDDYTMADDDDAPPAFEASLRSASDTLYDLVDIFFRMCNGGLSQYSCTQYCYYSTAVEL